MRNSGNSNEWFEIKEKSAGVKRLKISWFIYKYFGKNVVYLIAFFVSFYTFILNSDLRGYSEKYFEILYKYTGDNRYRPNLINVFRHILSYGYSLVDKMAVFGGKFRKEDIIFPDGQIKIEAEKDLDNGIFFVCNHIGNVDIMRSFIDDKRVTSVFLQKNQCEIFNNFIRSISKEQSSLKTYPVEEIDITTAVELEEDLKKGGVSFMAGDRLSASRSDKTLSGKLLGCGISLPYGVFKLAGLMPSEIYFVSCLKNGSKYFVYLKHAVKGTEEEIKNSFVEFLEEMILKSPYQFYHFYDYFMV